MPPHLCVRVAVDERELIPRPLPQGHQVKARARTLWGEPVLGRQDSWWRYPAARGENEAQLGGDRPAPPGFGCRHRPLAAWCEPRKPANMRRPSHVVPMMPMARYRRRDARRSRPGPRAVDLSLTCALIFQPLADDSQPGEDVLGADPKEAAGWSGAILWRRGVGRRAVVTRSGRAGRPPSVRILDDSTAQAHRRHLPASRSAGKLRRCWHAPPRAGSSQLGWATRS